MHSKIVFKNMQHNWHCTILNNLQASGIWVFNVFVFTSMWSTFDWYAWIKNPTYSGMPWCKERIRQNQSADPFLTAVLNWSSLSIDGDTMIPLLRRRLHPRRGLSKYLVHNLSHLYYFCTFLAVIFTQTYVGIYELLQCGK